MELGGVGRPPWWWPVDLGLAATVAKLSLPAQKADSRGFGMSTKWVLPAKARAMLDGLLLRAISTAGIGSSQLSSVNEISLQNQDKTRTGEGILWRPGIDVVVRGGPLTEDSGLARCEVRGDTRWMEQVDEWQLARKLLW